jgi:hypothetical protein
MAVLDKLLPGAAPGESLLCLPKAVDPRESMANVPVSVGCSERSVGRVFGHLEPQLLDCLRLLVQRFHNTVGLYPETIPSLRQHFTPGRSSTPPPEELVFDPKGSQGLGIRPARDAESMRPLEGAQRRRGLEAHDPVDGTWFVTEASECLLRERHLAPVPRERVRWRSIDAGRHLLSFYVLPALAGRRIEQNTHAQNGKRDQREGAHDTPMRTATPPAGARPPRRGRRVGRTRSSNDIHRVP